jgi:N-acetylmuramoyl-L-alanine amidase
MKFKELHKILLVGLLCLIASLYCSTAEAKDFVVVIDAGHGGHDPGAIGRRGKEKNINLEVALKVGKLIEHNCKNVKVIYTRKKDVFVTLNGRADIANKAKADLFISIHTNSMPKGHHSTQGAETYTLGLHRTADNLDVAKRENSVILIEDNYQQRYAGFNPNSSESYIIFEFIQDKYMKQSVRLATLIQRQFRNYAGRPDKGVHQAGFLVLRETYMPSVLVELGYISSPTEENYLLSDAGTSALANSIYNAFISYKREHDVESPDKSEPDSAIEVTVPDTAIDQPVREKNIKSENVTVSDTDRPVFKIQFYISSEKLPNGSPKFKGLSPVNYYKEDGIYKYTYGESTDYNKVYRANKEVRTKFKDSFIIATKNGKKMNVHDAINEFKKNRNKHI